MAEGRAVEQGRQRLEPRTGLDVLVARDDLRAGDAVLEPGAALGVVIQQYRLDAIQRGGEARFGS